MAGAGDNGGDRQSFTLDDMQRGALGDALMDDGGEWDKGDNQSAFWRAAGDRLGFDPATVVRSIDFEDSGVFSAVATGERLPGDGGAAEADHSASIDRMAALAEALEMTSAELVFDARDALLGMIKANPKPWSAYSPGQQRDVAAACEQFAQELVRRVVEVVAAPDPQKVRVLLTKIAIGDDIQITGKVKCFSEDEEDQAVSILHHARGKHVMLTVASADDYKEGAREAETDVEEPALNFEAGDDQHREGEEAEEEEQDA